MSLFLQHPRSYDRFLFEGKGTFYCVQLEEYGVWQIEYAFSDQVIGTITTPLRWARTAVFQLISSMDENHRK